MMSLANRSFVSRAVCSVASLCAFTSALQPTPARASVLKDGDVVEIIGDSITEQKLYSMLIEDYLLMCQPTKVRVLQFGWGGEQASGLDERISDPLTFKPNVVTTCYGMNDGHYRPIDDEIRENYRKNLSQAIDTFAKAGVTVIVGGPGAVDTKSFKHPTVTPEQYNENLAALSAEAGAIAKQHGFAFANLHSIMSDAMKAAKAKYGEDYLVAGSDGIHPHINGHVIMAYAFLKAMGFDGNLGEIDVDLPLAHADVTGPHKVVEFKKGVLTLESTRYPFCFSTNSKGPTDIDTTAPTTEFVPFNQDLNRLILKVTAPAGQYHVTWGPQTKDFSADQLKAGINLPAEFVQSPYQEAFNAVQGRIQQQQAFETPLLKEFLHQVDQDKSLSSEIKDELLKKIEDADRIVFEAAAASVQPVTTTIKIEAVQ